MEKKERNGKEKKENGTERGKGKDRKGKGKKTEDQEERKRKGKRCEVAPGDGISIKLQEFEEVLSFLSITGLLLGSQGVVGHKQGMSAAPCKHAIRGQSHRHWPSNSQWKNLDTDYRFDATYPNLLRVSYLWHGAPASFSCPKCCGSSQLTALPWTSNQIVEEERTSMTLSNYFQRCKRP